MHAPGMRIAELFTDQELVACVQRRLPAFSHLAELENSRAGEVGMEVGSARERIVVAWLIYRFGEDDVETDIPITEPEVDVKVFGRAVSIKTLTGRKLGASS